MKRSSIPFIALAALIVLAAVIAGCSSSGSSPSGGNTAPPPAASGGSSSGGATSGGTAVTIANFAFSPGTINVKVGDQVTWTNQDSATHDVEGDGGISSGPLAQGKTYSMTFSTAGTFNYKCAIHPSMTGQVVVK